MMPVTLAEVLPTAAEVAGRRVAPASRSSPGERTHAHVAPDLSGSKRTVEWSVRVARPATAPRPGTTLGYAAPLFASASVNRDSLQWRSDRLFPFFHCGER